MSNKSSVADHHVKITKAQARDLSDWLPGLGAAGGMRTKLLEQISSALDKAQAADLEQAESNIVIIEVVETL